MPFNGAGVYTAPGADFPVVTQTTISSTHFNNTINDIATALSTCMTKDGQQVATANISMGGFRLTNAGITAIAGSVGTPAINVSDASTGLYRSAVSELAVSVSGTQVARFASTGLIVTGALSSSTTITATTSMVTSLVGTITDVSLDLQVNNAARWRIYNSASLYALAPIDDTLSSHVGLANRRIDKGYILTLDSGTSGALSFATNDGTKQAQVFHSANAVNLVTLSGGAAGVGAKILVGGPSVDASADLNLSTNGGGAFGFFGGSFGSQQFGILSTAGSTRYATVTGSNGGNPTISTTAGSLAITPAVVMASTLSAVGITSTGDIIISTKRLQAAAGANIASANNLTLGGDGNFFILTGTTQVNLIERTGWQAGSVITLASSGGTVLMKHNQANSGNFNQMLLAGSVDLSLTLASTVTFVFDGANNRWQEISRKIA